MKHACWYVLGLCVATACTFQKQPSVRPEKIRAVSPPIQARALLLITPTFQGYVSESTNHGTTIRAHYGEAAAKALSALVNKSFATAEIRRLPDEEVRALLSGPADASTADVLLVPSIESAAAELRIVPDRMGTDADGNAVVVEPGTTDAMTEVTLRLNARSLRSESAFTWEAEGGGLWVNGSWGRITGDVVEEALRALRDSLAAHRAELELASPGP